MDGSAASPHRVAFPQRYLFLIQNIFENLIDGYDADFISVSSDRVDTRSPRGLVGAGLTRKSKRKMRSVNGVYGLGLTINPSLVLPDPL